MQSVRWQCYIEYRNNYDGFIMSRNQILPSSEDPAEFVAKWLKFIRDGKHDLFILTLKATI